MRLKKSRLSLFSSRFSNETFNTFVRINSRALNENAMMSDVFLVIQSTARISFAKNLVFDNLEPLIHDNLIDAKLDFYDEARLAQIDLRIREELESYIILATQRQASTLPNIFTKTKSLDESAIVIKRQACFDDALSARDIHKFRLFKANHTLAYDNNVYIIILTYHDDQLKIYTIHLIQSIDSKKSLEFHMTQLDDWALTSSYEQFQQGTSAFRNARDWAKTQRDELIVVVNNRVIEMLNETFILESSTYRMS